MSSARRPPWASSFDELAAAIDKVRKHLDSIKTVIAVMPEDQQHEVVPMVLSATQSLDDLYAEFAMDVLRMLSALGKA